MSQSPYEIVIEATAQITAVGVGISAFVSRDEPWPSVAQQPIVDLPRNLDIRSITGWKQTPEIRQQDAFCQQTIACGKVLIDQSPALPEAPLRRAVFLGSAYGALESEGRHMQLLLAEGPDNASPTAFRNAVSNAVLGHMAIAFGFGGASSMVLSGEVSGLYAMGFSVRHLRMGGCDVAITGATDSASSLVKRRFLAGLAANETSATPLMAGSCLMMLRRRDSREGGHWGVGGHAFGRVGGSNARDALTHTVSRALEEAGLRSADVEMALVHATRGTRFCAGPAVIETCLDLFVDSSSGSRRIGATAVPLMLNVCSALEALPRGRAPALIGAAPGGPVGELPPVSRLLVVAVDPVGSVAAAVFVHA